MLLESALDSNKPKGDAEWRARVAQPETLSIGELNHAVRFLREELHQKQLRIQELELNNIPTDRTQHGAVQEADPAKIRETLRKFAKGDLTLIGVLNELNIVETHYARRYFDAVAEVESNAIRDVISLVNVSEDEFDAMYE